MSIEGFQSILTEFYTNKYKGREKHDSPEASRVRLARRIASIARNSAEPRLAVLDIGAGRQSLESQFTSSYNTHSWFHKMWFVTVDIADISHHTLLMRNKRFCDHVNADGGYLPFPTGSFDVLVSNHAIDFLPRTAFNEARRILNEDGGSALFNFHHPTMLKSIGSVTQGPISTFWQHLIDTHHLFQTPSAIEQELALAGFCTQEVRTQSDSNDTWWEVSAVPIK